MIRFIQFADNLSAWFGKAFAWLIVLMSAGTGYEVFVRYLLNSPTAWALDVSFIMYGTLFMMGGAYTLSRGGHVRGDFLYRLWQPRTQAKVDFVLYLLFFFPGVTALIFTGWKYAARSWQYGEVSVNSPCRSADLPVQSRDRCRGHPAFHPRSRTALPVHHRDANQRVDRSG